MKQQSTPHVKQTTSKSNRLSKKVLTLSLLLMTLTLSLLLPTTSYAQVEKIDSATVKMSVSDLHELIYQITENKAKATALQEALTAERTETDTYITSVKELIEAQEAERQALIKAMNRPKLELYTGYNTSDKWEGGIRIVWQLK